jgi:hypothetical protein
MQRNTYLFLIFISLIAVILVAGCTSSSTAPAATPAATTAPVTSAPAPTQAPVTSESTMTVVASTPAAVSTTASTTDPILHRWVRQYPVLTGQTHWAAYEFKFYPDGTVVYNYGTPKETAGNIQVVSSYEATGTWAKSGNNTYLLHYLPLGATGAQIVDEYTYVPQAIDKEYGRTIPEHIVSQDEIDEYAHSAREIFADEMMYPERAKVD